MDKIQKVLCNAKNQLGHSVVRMNPTLEVEVKDKAEDYRTFGIKNTKDIPDSLIDILRRNPHFLWTTVDKMAYIGRSIDVELANPLTYRYMTGSTSGGAINILLGINDIAIGTDGGGSVLAPALSCNLFSVLGKGFGLVAKKDALSTDDIPFQPGIGFIANKWCDLESVLNTVTPIKWMPKEEQLKIVIPEQGNCRLPDGEDMYERIMSYLAGLIAEYEVIMYKFEDIYDRIQTLKDTKYIFEVLKADIILTFEGPIDVFGYDETIPRSFEGKVAQAITMPRSKGIVKVANIYNCTAFTIPSDHLASGFVVCISEGEDNAVKAFGIAKKISNTMKRPKVFNKYFRDREKFVEACRYE